MTLESGSVGLVLLAALMHACWNAIVKANDDGLLILAAVKIPTMFIGGVLLAVLGLPAQESWPFAAASALAFAGYAYCLLLGYRIADLNFVYPIARGAAPLLIAIASGLIFGEFLSVGEWAGFLLACSGILAMSLRGRPTNLTPALLAALGVSVCIASYTVSDGWGARLSGNALAYSALGNLLSGLLLVTYVCLRRGRALANHLHRHWGVAAIGGTLMFSSYAAVVFAMTIGPLAHIAALRETSVIFAALIGALILKEPAGKFRVAASALVAVGIVVMLGASAFQ